MKTILKIMLPTLSLIGIIVSIIFLAPIPLITSILTLLFSTFINFKNISK